MSKNDSTIQKQDVISLADEEAVKQVLVSSVLGLWDVVNNLTRLKPSRHDRYRVTIFGSARVKPGTFGYEETKRAAAALAEMGCDIITGGGPGLMQAANEGAAGAPDRAQSVGIRVDLPFEQEVNAFVTEAFEHRTFFQRSTRYRSSSASRGATSWRKPSATSSSARERPGSLSTPSCWDWTPEEDVRPLIFLMSD